MKLSMHEYLQMYNSICHFRTRKMRRKADQSILCSNYTMFISNWSHVYKGLWTWCEKDVFLDKLIIFTQRYESDVRNVRKMFSSNWSHVYKGTWCEKDDVAQQVRQQVAKFGMGDYLSRQGSPTFVPFFELQHPTSGHKE